MLEGLQQTLRCSTVLTSKKSPRFSLVFKQNYLCFKARVQTSLIPGILLVSWAIKATNEQSQPAQMVPWQEIQQRNTDFGDKVI